MSKSVKEMIIHLLDEEKMTPQAISEAMDQRVSTRTIYRWSKGESVPQNQSDLSELERIYQEKSAAIT
jgi:tryptophanyl-tRNA synthetase